MNRNCSLTSQKKFRCNLESVHTSSRVLGSTSTINIKLSKYTDMDTGKKKINFTVKKLPKIYEL